MHINDILADFATDDLIFELRNRGLIVEAIDEDRVLEAIRDRGRDDLATPELAKTILLDGDHQFQRLRIHVGEYLDSVVASAIDVEDAIRARSLNKSTAQ